MEINYFLFQEHFPRIAINYAKHSRVFLKKASVNTQQGAVALKTIRYHFSPSNAGMILKITLLHTGKGVVKRFYPIACGGVKKDTTHLENDLVMEVRGALKVFVPRKILWQSVIRK